MRSWRFGAATDTGKVRDQNEDRWRADPILGLFIVSDGMGGAAHGEIAAQYIVDELPGHIEKTYRSPVVLPTKGDALNTAVAAASDELHLQRNASQVGGATATVVAAWIYGNTCAISYLGDSRAYLLRHDRVDQLTVDHSLAQLLVDAGELGKDRVAEHPGRNKLMRFAGMPPPAQPGAVRVDLQPLDRILLCSDGISGALNTETLRLIIGRDEPPQVVCNLLIDAANQAGGHDNMTALLIDIDG
ncbi:MAG: PP2C family protein-serine/threonine phosphatase [Mycobacterium sp.]